MGSIFSWISGTLGVVIFLIVGLVQIYAGYLGIEYHLGSGWAIGAVIATLFFQFPIILTVGTFFGALDVWGWPWYGALALAAPGLLFIVPALVTGAISTLVEKKNENKFSRSFNPEPSSYQSEDLPKNVTPKKKKKIIKKIAKKKKKTKK